MGGLGSGNFYHTRRPAKKAVVEHCRQLDANRWAREGILRAGVRLSGRWHWTDRRTGQETAAISYDVDTTDPDDARVWLSYTVTRDGAADWLRYLVPLQRTRMCRGRLRWWFTCPLQTNDQECGRRVAKLYLPPRGRYFGCRQCHRLAYTSSQESHKSDRLWRMMAKPGEDPRELRRVFNRLCRWNR